MATFGRTAAQDVMWVELNDIRNTVDAGLLGPEDGDYEDGEGELQEEWEELIVEYREIHTDNGTFG